VSARPTTLLDPDSATLAGTGQAGGRFEVEAVREQFPILTVRRYGKPLAYLDSAATSQKPQAVIDAMSRFFSRDNANVHRGVHYLSERATEAYEGARVKAQGFLNATEVEETVFTRGTTEGINLVAATYGAAHLGEGDEVLITEMEHHSNIVPWQMLCERQGAQLRVAPISDAGELLLDELEELISERTKLVAITHVSNVLGRSTRSGRSPRSPTPLGPPSSSTARKRPPISPLTCRRSAVISTRCPATRCTGRPASASSTDGASCSRRCPPTRAAAT